MTDVMWNRFRWAVWATVLGLWTLALLTPYPVHASREVLPEEARYTSSKLLHVGIYTGLTLLTAWLPASRRLRPWLLGLLIAHAPLTEFFQNFVPMRTGTLNDVAYDLTGVGLGLIATWRWWLGSGPSSEVASDPNSAPSTLKHPSYYTSPADRQRSA